MTSHPCNKYEQIILSYLLSVNYYPQFVATGLLSFEICVYSSSGNCTSTSLLLRCDDIKHWSLSHGLRLHSKTNLCISTYSPCIPFINPRKCPSLSTFVQKYFCLVRREWRTSHDYLFIKAFRYSQYTCRFFCS